MLSVSEALVSDTTDADDPASIITSITRAIKRISLFTVSLSLYALFASNRRLQKLEVVLMDLFSFSSPKKRENKTKRGMGYQIATAFNSVNRAGSNTQNFAK